MASNNDNLVDYIFDIGENAGDIATIIYVVTLGTVLKVFAGVTILPEFETVTASDGTTTTQALFSLSEQFMAAGSTSITWAGALALMTAVAGLVLTQGIEFFHPKNVREADSFEEIFEWIAGVGTFGVPASIVFDIGGIKSTITADPVIGVGVFGLLILAYVWLVDSSRWD